MGSFLGDLASKINGGSTAADGQDTVKLLVNGKSYEGWQSVTVKRSLKAVSGAFDLGVVAESGDDRAPWGIIPGYECKVQIGSDTVITGYVDTVSPKFDSGSRSVGISGRDKTADIVDASAVPPPSSWMNISLFALAKKLAKPFGVAVSVDPSAAKESNRPLLNEVRLHPGESVFEFLERQARFAAVLLTSDGAGGILITKSSYARAATNLVQGENLVSAEAEYDFKGRFGKYVVYGQGLCAEGESVPELDFLLKGVATDPEVKRYRPMVITAEKLADPAAVRKRAEWEAKVRAAKSARVRATVVGWRQGDGTLWRPNLIAVVKSSWLGINLEMLITSVTLTKSNAGTLTDLELERADAYSPDPTVTDKYESMRQLVVQESKR